MTSTGLVLEGGGMRGVYTAGVLEYFMEQDFYLPYVIGVSAGACQAASYLSRQKGRNKQVCIGYVQHPDYISIKNLFRKKQLFGMDLIFDAIPNQLVPFDYETFHQTGEKFLIGTTDCITGEAVYYEKSAYRDKILPILRASSSLPFMAPVIEFEGRVLMDGGISDPIPLKRSEQDGNQKNIVILTRNDGYLKRRSKMNWLAKRFYPKYEGLIQRLDDRFQKYNDTISYISEKEASGDVYVIRPTEPLKVSRVERDPVKLTELYEQGYEDAAKHLEHIKKWIKQPSELVKDASPS
ncbi:patatin family protein [Alkalihalobacillus sp. AL-G]|uniref:patatin-like phospholipase family protein n=1 Tax=Alkalihalobacillus sp. AL-G TaxID=2926399 RepID=UPI00272ABC7D|nr:patatin family protein [Alkalihalobacillus sp. AL-G]WLD94199.1 patatin family protein [Alkalihalobacillus sp. AL-G]